MREPGRPLLRPGADWDAMRAAFRWPRLRRFNIAEACCDAWARAEPDRLALRYVRPDGEVRDYELRAAGAGLAAVRQRAGGARASAAATGWRCCCRRRRRRR